MPVSWKGGEKEGLIFAGLRNGGFSSEASAERFLFADRMRNTEKEWERKREGLLLVIK